MTDLETSGELTARLPLHTCCSDLHRIAPSSRLLETSAAHRAACIRFFQTSLLCLLPRWSLWCPVCPGPRRQQAHLWEGRAASRLAWVVSGVLQPPAPTPVFQGGIVPRPTVVTRGPGPCATPRVYRPGQQERAHQAEVQLTATVAVTQASTGTPQRSSSRDSMGMARDIRILTQSVRAVGTPEVDPDPLPFP